MIDPRILSHNTAKEQSELMDDATRQRLDMELAIWDRRVACMEMLLVALIILAIGTLVGRHCL